MSNTDSFNPRFKSTKGSHIQSFFNNEYQNYATYKVFQRLPHILDTVAGTQRKLITVLEKLPPTRKIKTAETYAMIYNEMKYIHGDASAFSTSESMSRGSSNNLNIFTEEGNFGFRTNRSAAGPRYTNTRFSKIARIIFRSEDKPILGTQEFEGVQIEPPFLLPIVPVSLINGFEAIAVGYASKFLPRHPEDVIDSIIKVLRAHKRTGNFEARHILDLRPVFPYFNGDIVRDESKPTASAWFLRGKLTKMKRKNWVEVTEVPPMTTRESYIKKLKKLQEKGTVKDYNEKCVKNTFYFTIKLDPDIWAKKTEAELIKILGLEDTYSDNFSFINPQAENASDAIVTFNQAEEYLLHFIEERQKYYGVRKEYILKKILEDIRVLENKIKFIKMVNAGEIVITKRKKADLEKELESHKFDKLEGSYDYLLGIRLWNLTEEMVQKHNESVAKLQAEHSIIEDTTIEDMHITELMELKKEMKTELIKKQISAE